MLHVKDKRFEMRCDQLTLDKLDFLISRMFPGKYSFKRVDVIEQLIREACVKYKYSEVLDKK